VRRIASELTRTVDVEGVVRTLLDELGELFGVGFVALTFVSDDATEATGYLARSRGRDVPWWGDVRLDLRGEPSGIASTVFEATAFAIYDVAASPKISSRLAEQVGAKSAAYVPLTVGDRVIAVISVATTDEHRAFSADYLETRRSRRRRRWRWSGRGRSSRSTSRSRRTGSGSSSRLRCCGRRRC
jgi:GAF domain-containing protein